MKFVACNIYVTAAASSHAPTLLSLLRSAQDQCREIRAQDDDDDSYNTGTVNALSGNKAMAHVAVIHAYADKPYDRSSFHLAGRPDRVSEVASRLIRKALEEIELDCTTSADGVESRHPFVGLVDHVSVMPINIQDQSGVIGSECEAAANAAREIGRQMAETNLVRVHYYGMACPNKTSLASVRKEKTSFFKSGGAIDKARITEDTYTFTSKGDATVGAPVNFVENFNIRLTPNVKLEQAKTLTQFLRGRNICSRGFGVAGVEALTLPYVRDKLKGSKVFEVACNLTSPKEGSADDVQVQLQKWAERQRQEPPERGAIEEDASKRYYEYFVEDAYRVGTTEEQCISVLLNNKEDNVGVCKNDMIWEKYDNDVYSKFQELLH
eukprot:CAMPEP_0181094016 /NCGR_PEP_ID=MMETSP1071-20121207/9762_1 /TAXON_ID=35127 /ORGANISM="Thalassiosira sp., Strain NH16" /LENGTH=380 /DNA_ID=CAMNT_0023176305 /DNA_START=212 /DNA_END=1354 /DNA_ORIENTATION=-